MSVVINPENPYVLNPFFFANQTNSTYDQTWIAFIHRSNNILAAALGFITCSLVIYLVLNRTPVPFKPYSKIVLLCSCVDFYFLLVDLLTHQRLRVAGGALMFTVSGPMCKLNYWWQCHSMSLISSCISSAYMILPFQYYYRYLTIKNKESPTWTQLAAHLTLGFSIACTTIFTASLSYCTEYNRQKIDYTHLWYVEVPVPQLIFGLNNNLFTIIHATGFACLGTICYLFTFILARRTVYLLRRQALHMSRKTFELQRQFGRALFAQALAPLFCAIIPVAIAVFALFLKLDTGYLGEFVQLALTWFPFCNSLSTLIFIVPFRNFCLRPIIKVVKKFTRKSRQIYSMSLPLPSHPTTEVRELTYEGQDNNC